MTTFGSVCSGIEAASVAWHPLGWRAAWLAEIEPFPAAVLAHHFPTVPNLGDMTKLPKLVLTGKAAAPDVLVGGTPCQAFSVAGMREGLNDPRGQLTIKFVELADAIDHVRVARGDDPAVIVWENVPGVLSDKGNAFGCFLGALSGEDCELQPAGGKWSNAGCVFGPKRAVAWRVLDAQFFGVAQRRRRVFVVASAGAGLNPAQVLFEFGGLRRDTPPRREPGQSVTYPVAPCLTSSGRGVERGGDTRGQDPVVAVLRGMSDYSDGLPSLRASGGDAAGGSEALVAVTLEASIGRSRGAGTSPSILTPVLCIAHGQGGAEIASERRTTLTCNHEAPIVVHGTQDPGVKIDLAHTLGRNNGGENVIALQDTSSRDKAQNGKGWSDEGTSYTLDAAATQGVAYPILEVGKRTGVSTTDPRAGLGIGNDADPMYTLQAGAQHGIAYSVTLRGREGGATAELGDEVGTCLRAGGGGGDKAHVLAPVVETLYNKGFKHGQYYACPQEAYTRTLLRLLFIEIGEEAFAKWGLGILNTLQSPEILQQALYGSSLRPAPFSRSWVVYCALSRKEGSPGWLLRSLRESGCQRCASQGWEPPEQLSRELGAYMSSLSQPGAQAERFMHDMWFAAEGFGLLRETLSAVQEVRRSNAGQRQPIHTDQACDRISASENLQGGRLPEPLSRERILREACSTGEAGHIGNACEDTERICKSGLGEATFAVRRLIVEECEFLQGFPRGYTQVPFRNKSAADGPRYKAIGNSMAVPCMAWIGSRIKMVLEWRAAA